jgi:hypothetical protein
VPAVLLAIGVPWSPLERRLAGQMVVDEAEHH